MIKVGVIGAGFIGMQHIEAIGRIPGVKIVAITDNNVDHLNNLKSKGLCDRIYTDYNEMFKQEDLDAVHNCTPTNIHFDVNKKAIESNLHIYAEKPLVKTLDDALILLDLLDGKKLVTAVNFNYRNNMLVQEMHERIKSKEFGRTLFLQGEYLQDWMMFESDYDWRVDREIGGESRALADIGSHCFDIMEYVTSKKIVEVNAKLFKVFDKRKKFDGRGTFKQANTDNENYELMDVENEDGGVIQAKFEDGTIGSFVVSQISAGKKNGLRINVSGEFEALEWSQEQSDRLWVGHRDRGNEEIYADAKYVSQQASKFATLPNGHPVGWHDALTNGMKAFYRAIEEEDYSKEQPFATFYDGYHVMKVVDACLESDKTNEWVKIK